MNVESVPVLNYLTKLIKPEMKTVHLTNICEIVDWTKARTDRIDLQIKDKAWQVRIGVPTLIAAGATGFKYGANLLSANQPENLAQLPWYKSLAEAIHYPSLGINAAAIVSLSLLYMYRYGRDPDTSRLIGYETLSTLSELVVFRGNDYQIGSNITLKKGDNILYVSLPRPYNEAKLTPQAKELYQQALRQAVATTKSMYKGIEYQAVAIDPTSYIAGTLLETASRVKNTDLLQGKKVCDREGELIIITPEAFDRLDFNPTTQFKQALEALKDPVLEEYFALASRATSESQLQAARKLIDQYIKSRLHTHVMSQFSEPSLVRASFPRHRKKIYETIQLFTELNGKLVIQRSSTDNGFVRKPLHQVLGVEEKVTIDKLKADSSHYQGQLLYLIYEMVRRYGLRDLTSAEFTTPSDVARKLNHLGYPFALSKDSLNAIADTRKKRNLLKQIEQALLPILVAGFIYAAEPHFEKVLANMDLYDLPKIVNVVSRLGGQQGKVEPVSDISIRARHRSSVPGATVPAHTVDWAVVGSLESRGYYTLETSHQMKSGEWIINQDRARVLNLPTEMPKEKDPQALYLTIARQLELPFEGVYRFKLPTREDTELTHFKIELDKDKYTVYQLTDGTIEVEIRQDLFDFVPTAFLEASFQKTSQPVVRAVKPMEPIDETKLTAENLEKIKEAKSASASVKKFLEDITFKVFRSHLYSIDSSNKDKLDSLTSAEELVSIVAGDTVCDCDTCNAAAALETTLGQSTTDFVNVAYGYLNGTLAIEQYLNNQPFTAFLRGDTRHAYMLTNQGTILDSTPVVLNWDEPTRKYIDNLKKSLDITNNDDKDDFFARAQRLIEGKTGINPSPFFNIGRIIAGTGAIAGLYLSSRYFLSEDRRRKILQAAKHTSQQITLSPLTTQDLGTAYNFFSWMSYGGSTTFKQGAISDSSRESLLSRIRGNYSEDGIARYHTDPDRFEKAAGIGRLTALKMRYISRLLLRGS